MDAIGDGGGGGGVHVVLERVSRSRWRSPGRTSLLANLMALMRDVGQTGLPGPIARTMFRLDMITVAVRVLSRLMMICCLTFGKHLKIKKSICGPCTAERLKYECTYDSLVPYLCTRTSVTPLLQSRGTHKVLYQEYTGTTLCTGAFPNSSLSTRYCAMYA